MKQRLSESAVWLFARTLAAIEVESVVRAQLRLADHRLYVGEAAFDLRGIERVIIVAIGKASVGMARATRQIIGARFHSGIIVSNEAEVLPPPGFSYYQGGHPTPNQASLAAAAHALDLLRRHDAEDTLVVFLLSGGGSALFELPLDERLTLADLQAANRVLVNCGAVIHEMNAVRRRLSAVKGGRLAAVAARAWQLSLYISDVNSGDLAALASGPTWPDETTPAEVQRVLDRYDLPAQFPPRVAAALTTPAPAALPANDRQKHHLLLDNAMALQQAEQIAAAQGWVVEVAHDLVEGEVEALARAHLERARALRWRHPGQTVCLLSGGEAICPVRGIGQGGRNQEFVLRAMLAMEELGLRDLVCLSAGTDGIDGQSPAAGACADSELPQQARALGLDARAFLQNSDSFGFFERLNAALITGPTGNNVRDLRIMLAC